MRVERGLRWLLFLAVGLAGACVVLGRPLVAGAVLLATLGVAAVLAGRTVGPGLMEARRRRSRRRPVHPATERRADFLTELAARERALERVRDTRPDRRRGLGG